MMSHRPQQQPDQSDIDLYRVRAERRRQQNRENQRKRRARLRELQQHLQQADGDGRLKEPRSDRELSHMLAGTISTGASSSSDSYQSGSSTKILDLRTSTQARSVARVSSSLPSTSSSSTSPTSLYGSIVSTTTSPSGVTDYEVDLFDDMGEGKDAIMDDLSSIFLGSGMAQIESPRLRKVLYSNFSFVRALYYASDALGLPRSTLDGEDTISDLAQDFAAFQLRQTSAIPEHVLVSEIASSFAHAAATDDSIKQDGSANAVSRLHKYNWKRLPPCYTPTQTQSLVPHHPWIDLGFPWAAVRSNLLLMLQKGFVDEDALCDDLSTLGVSDGINPPFIYHQGNSFDPDACEVSEEFFAKWWFLFVGDAASVIANTNKLRRDRGLPPLRLKKSQIARLSIPFQQK